MLKPFGLLIVMTWLFAGLADAQAPSQNLPELPGIEVFYEDSPEDQRAEALSRVDAVLASEFAKTFPTILTWTQDERLPIQTRSALLRSALTLARTQTAPEFDQQAQGIFENLIEQLPEGL